MYPVYKTEGIVLKSAPQGESSRIFFVYTSEFGLIRLKAAGIRKLTSKLRFHLEDYSLVSLELVRGKDIWWPVAARKIIAYSFNLKVVANVANLVLRLCDLEEKNLPLFEDLKQGLIIFQKKGIDNEALEAVLVLRLLARLGYVGADSLLSFVKMPLAPEILPAAREKLTYMVMSINETLKQTSL
ncbi:MAG TPA: recombination protein O N-terminal domain-containing protein [Candidatus Paceibacterota bacterium]|nr:recombination protein O N-terminal domain-containing protein [Candidatus Paceibacterota bacterium]